LKVIEKNSKKKGVKENKQGRLDLLKVQKSRD